MNIYAFIILVRLAISLRTKFALRFTEFALALVSLFCFRVPLPLLPRGAQSE